jgi:8-oxo-dGTP pyrophosphatase MutT (NUDIX family)/phosphohistidine phosphatase SixA
VTPSPVVAAGCLVTREGQDGTEVLLVHRPRYDDWSLPKGKSEVDEHVTLTAVREVLEETGVTVALRRPIPGRKYQVDGASKIVHYWRAVVVDESEFEPNREVDVIRWLPVDVASATATHPDDAALVKLANDPAGTPFTVLRHGSAVKRVEWSGEDVDRPLDTHGTEQADLLVPRLGAYGVQRVHSSAARRCADTVRPYALAYGVPLAAEPALTEESFRLDPTPAFERASGLIADAWRTHEATVLCGHRPYLPDLVDHLTSVCPGVPDADPWQLPIARHRAHRVDDDPARLPGRTQRAAGHAGSRAPPLTLDDSPDPRLFTMR